MNRATANPALKPRKRPLQKRSEETVAALIEAAAQVLEADGLEGFNTNAVAAKAGVSIGSLYQYFPSKDALTIALMKREESQFYEECVAALGHSSGQEAMALFIEAAVRQQLARPRLARLLDIEESRPDLQRELRNSKSVRDKLEAVLKSEDLPIQSRPRLAASDLLAIIRGLTDAAGERGERDLPDLRARIGAAVLGYLERSSRL
jgi:AcrR family transcriptional regulator